MSLKKTDKIIAVVGVVILIVAVFGILFYYEAEDTVDDDDDGMATKEFDVRWTEYTVDDKITGNAQKKTAYNNPINITLDEGCILTTVEITIDWEDDHKRINFQ
jgi:flagellar basal body-associated protein FliL